MTQFRSFEEINAWQEARILIRKLREICKRNIVRKDFAFVDQITRASRSIAANIAEGNDCMTPNEFIHYLGISKRSAAEVRAHLYDALEEGYISIQEFDDLSLLSTKIGRMLAKLIHHLQALNPDIKRTYRVHQPINK